MGMVVFLAFLVIYYYEMDYFKSNYIEVSFWVKLIGILCISTALFLFPFGIVFAVLGVFIMYIPIANHQDNIKNKDDLSDKKFEYEDDEVLNRLIKKLENEKEMNENE